MSSKQTNKAFSNRYKNVFVTIVTDSDYTMF